MTAAWTCAILPCVQRLGGALCAVLTWLASEGGARAQPWPETTDPALQESLERLVRKTARRFRRFGASPGRIHAALVDLTEPRRPRRASWRGDRLIYPASLVKLPFLIAYFAAIEEGRIRNTAKSDRDARVMVQPSDDHAANRILGLVTGTRPGRALRGRALTSFRRKRLYVEEVMKRHGLARMRARGRFGKPRGRDRQIGGNKMSADETARLLTLLAQDALVSPRVSAQVKGLVLREAGRKGRQRVSDLVHMPFSAGLPPGTRVYSKAGRWSRWAHDAALVEVPGGSRFALSVFCFPCPRARAGHLLAAMARGALEILGESARHPKDRGASD